MNAKADACGYILIMLMQRLEKTQPGLLEEMIAGVERDRCAIPVDVPDRAHLEAVFDETLAMLRQADNA